MELSVLARFARPTMPHITPDPATITDPVEQGAAWAVELAGLLDGRARQIGELRDYYAGVQPIKYSTQAWRETYGPDFGLVTDSWCRLVIEAAIERMVVQGFRFGGSDLDDHAWEIWQRNRMDLDADVAHTDALVTAQSYAMVWPAEDGGAEITVEDPLNTIVVTDPANRRRRQAGMKRWERRDKSWEALVTTPDRWWRLESERGYSGWQVLGTDTHQLGAVPIVPLVNSPDVYGQGVSDLQPILGLQDAVNKLLSDEMVVAEHAGYPQRVLLGVEIPEDEDGNPRFDLVGGKGRWMAFEGDGEIKPEIQELQVADLDNFGKSIERHVQHIAALTRTPPHYLLGKVVNVSADALRAAESGLVSRVHRRNKLFGESWEEVMRLAFRLEGRTEQASMIGAETVWKDPETMSEAARVDALTKMRTLGIPEEMLWERWGMSPQEIDRARRMRDQEAALGALHVGVTANGTAPEPQPVPPEPGPVALEPPVAG